MHPQVAVIQSGYKNRFGHPVAEVLARLDERGARVQVSPTCGAWWWPAGAAAGSGVCERDTARRYWHHGAIDSASNSLGE